jgi:uncharacterized membrane protein YkoI
MALEKKWLIVVGAAVLCGGVAVAASALHAQAGPQDPAPAAAANQDDDDADDGAEEQVALSAVPAAALAAAKAAVQGVTFTSAEKELEGGRVVYSLEGTADGKRCEVEVTADGKVTEIEHGDDEDDDNDD